MQVPAARARWPSTAFALVLAGCGGGSSGGSVSTAAIVRQDAPAPTVAPPADATFTNPLLASGPDPYVVRASGVYFYTQTSGDRVALWFTTAMSRLGSADYATIFEPPRSGANSRDLWAPELHRLDDAWYVYYAAGDGSRTALDPHASQRMFVLENRDADPMRGTWVDRGRLESPDPDAWAIDGTVLEYGGLRYFIWSGRSSANDTDQHLYIERMASPLTLAGGRTLLSSPDHDWERAGRAGVNEAPQVLRNRAGRVFLLYSANGCWTDQYALGMLTLRDGGDPLVRADWSKSEQPVFASNAAGGAYGPGHNGVFTSPDGTEDWLLYHANASAGAGCGDARTPRMQRIRWRDDGTPDFGTPASPSAALPVPAGDSR